VKYDYIFKKIYNRFEVRARFVQSQPYIFCGRDDRTRKQELYRDSAIFISSLKVWFLFCEIIKMLYS